MGSGLAASEELNPGKRLVADGFGDGWVTADSRGGFVRGQRLGKQELHQAPSLALDEPLRTWICSTCPCQGGSANLRT
jgi:hypothetical protein